MPRSALRSSNKVDRPDVRGPRACLQVLSDSLCSIRQSPSPWSGKDSRATASVRPAAVAMLWHRSADIRCLLRPPADAPPDAKCRHTERTPRRTCRDTADTGLRLRPSEIPQRCVQSPAQLGQTAPYSVSASENSRSLLDRVRSGGPPFQSQTHH